MHLKIQIFCFMGNLSFSKNKISLFQVIQKEETKHLPDLLQHRSLLQQLTVLRAMEARPPQTAIAGRNAPGLSKGFTWARHRAR